MRVAVMCSGYGLVARGVETFIEGLMLRLRERSEEWEFDVYTRAPGCERRNGVRLIHVPAISRDSRLATIYAQIGHRLGFYLRTPNNAEGLSFAICAAPKVVRGDYDLVFNQAGPFSGWFLSQWRKRFGGPPFINKTASGYSPLELILKRQRPDLIVATSPFVQEWLQSEPPDTRVVCIPNAVDCAEFQPERAGEKDDTPPELQSLERPIILFVGAMEDMKRPFLAIEAMKKLGRGSLVMIGRGRLLDEVTSAGRNVLGPDRFLQIPHVPHDALPAYYRAADVFTLSSEEPFGIVYLEALASNVPFVAHNSPVQKWIAGDAGTTCNCEDAGEYAGAIAGSLDVEYGNIPRERAKAFDWSLVAAEYEKAFRSVVEGDFGHRLRQPSATAGRTE